MNTPTLSYEKMTKKELFDICESLKITSYKSKTKSELITLIKNIEKKVKDVEDIQEIEGDLLSDDEEVITQKIEQLTLSEPVFETNFESLMEINIEKMENMFKNIDNIENVVIDTTDSKITRLYELLHNANMRALNMQFKYRAQYPIAVYNNLEELKRRINTYNV